MIKEEQRSIYLAPVRPCYNSLCPAGIAASTEVMKWNPPVILLSLASGSGEKQNQGSNRLASDSPSSSQNRHYLNYCDKTEPSPAHFRVHVWHDRHFSLAQTLPLQLCPCSLEPTASSAADTHLSIPSHCSEIAASFITALLWHCLFLG